MTEAAILQGLSSLKKGLATESQTPDELWQSRQLLWQELGWEKPQLKLWLRCQSGLKQTTTKAGLVRYELTNSGADSQPDLGEMIAKIVQGVGKPMPLAQLKNKLPAGLVVTEPMLKAAITGHPNLILNGPLVKLN
jgi:hypothetical protein